MNRRGTKPFLFAIVALFAFLLLTFLLKTVDVQPIGPGGTSVGLAGINAAVFERFGVHPIWDKITDGILLLALLTAGTTALRGLIQWIRRKDLRKVDRDLLCTAGAYAATVLLYGFFEKFTVNFRPILTEDGAESSYPSSHILIVLCIFATALTVLCRKPLKRSIKAAAITIGIVLSALTFFGRLAAGMHWFTDALAALTAAAAIALFHAAACIATEKRPKHAKR